MDVWMDRWMDGWMLLNRIIRIMEMEFLFEN